MGYSGFSCSYIIPYAGMLPLICSAVLCAIYRIEIFLIIEEVGCFTLNVFFFFFFLSLTSFICVLVLCYYSCKI